MVRLVATVNNIHNSHRMVMSIIVVSAAPSALRMFFMDHNDLDHAVTSLKLVTISDGVSIYTHCVSKKVPTCKHSNFVKSYPIFKIFVLYTR